MTAHCPTCGHALTSPIALTLPPKHNGIELSVDNLRIALQIISQFPLAEQDNMISANTRRIAREALDAEARSISLRGEVRAL